MDKGVSIDIKTKQAGQAPFSQAVAVSREAASQNKICSSRRKLHEALTCLTGPNSYELV